MQKTIAINRWLTFNLLLLMKRQHLSTRKNFLTRIGLGLAGAFSFVAASAKTRNTKENYSQDLPLAVKPARHLVARKTSTEV